MYAAVHVLPEVLVYVTLFVIAAPPDWKVTTGVPIVSLAVRVKVTTSPSSANVDVELLEAIPTDVNVGTESSNVTLDPSVTAVTATPALPDVSAKAILKVTDPSVSLEFAVYFAVHVLPSVFT